MDFELYDPEKSYIDENGNYITPAMFYEKHNAAMERPMVVGVYDRTIMSVEDYGYKKAMLGLPIDVSDEKALKRIKEDYIEQGTENTPIERIASAMEYIVIHLLEEKH